MPWISEVGLLAGVGWCVQSAAHGGSKVASALSTRPIGASPRARTANDESCAMCSGRRANTARRSTVHREPVGRYGADRGERAAHGNGSRDVGRVPDITRRIHHHDVPRPGRGRVLHIVELRAVRPGAHDRSVGHALGAEPGESVFQRRPQFVLVPRIRHQHRGPVPGRADLGRPSQECNLRGALASPKLIDHRVRVAEVQPGMRLRELAHELLAPRQGIGVSEISVGEVGQCVERKPVAGKRVEHPPQRAERATGQSGGLPDRGGVGPAAIVQRRSRVDGREEQGTGGMSVVYHQHEGRIRFVEAGQVMEGRQLKEGAEVRDRCSAAEGHDHAAVDTSGQRIAASGVFVLGDLGSDRRGERETGKHDGAYGGAQRSRHVGNRGAGWGKRGLRCWWRPQRWPRRRPLPERHGEATPGKLAATNRGARGPTRTLRERLATAGAHAEDCRLIAVELHRILDCIQ